MSKVDSYDVEMLALKLYETLTGSVLGFGSDERTVLLREVARKHLESKNV
jgi:hypothetical protein